MKILVFISLAAYLGSIPVQAYGPRRQYNNHGWSHGPPDTSPEAFHPSSFHGPSHGSYHGYSSSHGYSHKHYRPPHDFYYYDAPYFGPPSSQEDSTKWNSGSGSWESNEDSSEFSGPLNDWHDRRPCKGSCKRPIKKPSRTTTTPLPRTTRTKRPRPTQATVPPHSQNLVSKKPTDSTTRRSTVSSTETTSTPIETTTTEEFPTESPQILSCIESCITTPEFNPVCGTDGETYINEGRLHCAKGCGVDVTLRRKTVCPPPPFFGEDNERPTPPPTTITSPNFIARTTLFSGLQRCMKQCAIAPTISPVCGTNFVTYFNIERLKCAQECGEDVQVLCERPCAACGVAPITVTTRTAPSTLVPGPYATSTVKPETKECLDSCPITSESNPVCGTDQVTYRNPSHLLCAQICGIGVTVARFSACPSPITTPPTTSDNPIKTESPSRLTSPESPTTTESQTFLICLRRCPVTSEFNPVCGTDDLTYSNPGYLECAKLCGLEVELKQKSPCDFDIDAETTTLQTNLDEKREPSLTGSRSTATATSLFTSPTTMPTTNPVSTWLTTTSPIPTTTTASISTTRSTSGSTILPDILNKIFGSVTTGSPTRVPNPDDDEDVDLDARFGNDTTNDSDISRIIFPE